MRNMCQADIRSPQSLKAIRRTYGFLSAITFHLGVESRQCADKLGQRTGVRCVVFANQCFGNGRNQAHCAGGRPAWSTAVGLGPIPYQFAGENPASRTLLSDEFYARIPNCFELSFFDF